VAAAISAMQREAYGAGAVSPDDFVGADMAIEHVANPSVAEVHDVVVAAVAGKIDLSHGVGRELSWRAHSSSA